MVPAALGRSRRPLALSFETEGRRERHLALVALVANNDYSLRTMADLGGRTRLDEGLLHAYVVEAVGRAALLRLLVRTVEGRSAGARGWVEWAAEAFTAELLHGRVHAAIDGEPVVLASPLEFAIRPRALRALVPPA